MDFSKIRGLEAGQRQSFESLMCQLAKSDRPVEAKEFRRIEGAGGDGGVEAYWLLTDGSKIGYQAKFFTRAGSIDWAQIDESVEQAIKTHPTLIKYVVALACDLTDKSGVKGRGATGWQHWQARVAKWNAHRAELGQEDIVFVVWPASELSDRLTAPDCEGVTQHGLRQEEWRFLLPVVLENKNKRKFIQILEGEKSIDVDTWSPSQRTDAGFLLEAPWRHTWPQEMYTEDKFRTGKSVKTAIPCVRYLWESHLDCSLPNGASAILPAPWLARQLTLNPIPGALGRYGTNDGKVQFISSDAGSEGSYAFIDKSMFEAYLKQNELTCVWVFIAERGVWPGGANENAAWRRVEGAIWLDRGKPKMTQWVKNEANGKSKEFLPPSTDE